MSDLPTPFDHLPPPTPPPELRERVLAAARQALAAKRPEAPALTLWDRLWQSPTARWAWAASMAALLALNLWLDQTAARGPALPANFHLDPTQLAFILQNTHEPAL